MFSTLIEKLGRRDDLTTDEAATAMALVMRGEATPAQIAGLLIGLSMKGERPAELVGFARTMRAQAVQLKSPPGEVFDTCGTGGDRSGTFNISTGAALVVAACGVRVAKHGNRSVSSQCGSADVLRALGVKVELTPDQVARSLDEIGIGFMFAPLHHAATKRVALIRRELGVRTIFNLLGPLTNPAGAPFQIAGVSHPTASEKVAQAMARLGTRRAWVVRGTDGLDEITLGGETIVYEAGPDGVRRFEIAPEDFGLRRSDLQTL